MAMAQMYLSAGPMLPNPEPLPFCGDKSMKEASVQHPHNTDQIVALEALSHGGLPKRHHDRQTSPSDAAALLSHSQVDSTSRKLSSSGLRSAKSSGRLRKRGHSSRMTSPPPPSYRELSPVPPSPAYTLPSSPSSTPMTHATIHKDSAIKPKASENAGSIRTAVAA